MNKARKLEIQENLRTQIEIAVKEVAHAAMIMGKLPEGKIGMVGCFVVDIFNEALEEAIKS